MKKVFFLALSLAALPVAFAASAEDKNGLLPPGAAMPDFSLTEVVGGKTVSSADFRGKPAVVVVFCRHCPFVQHVKKAIGEVARDYSAKGIGFVGVSANDPAAYPEDSPESLKEMALEEQYAFPVLFDASQEFAKSLTAVATPDFFVFDKDGKLAYRGRMDGARPGNGVPADGQDLRAALDALLAGKPAPAEQKPAVGCSIKWKEGNVPAYWS